LSDKKKFYKKERAAPQRGIHRESEPRRKQENKKEEERTHKQKQSSPPSFPAGYFLIGLFPSSYQVEILDL